MADDVRLIGHLRQATVELVGVTNYPPTSKSRWWRPDGKVGRITPHLYHEVDDTDVDVRQGTRGVTFLIRLQFSSPEQPSYDQGESGHSAADIPGEPTYRLPDLRPGYSQPGYRSTYEILRPAHQFIPWGRSREVAKVALDVGPLAEHLNLFSPSWWASSVVDADGNLSPDYYMFSAEVAAPAQMAVLRVGICEGRVDLARAKFATVAIFVW